MLDLQKDYLVVHAILGVQRLRTCVAVPVVTTANAMATVGGHTIYKVKGTQVLTAHGRVPDDKLDARCGAEPWARGPAPAAAHLMLWGSAKRCAPQHRLRAVSVVDVWHRPGRTLRSAGAVAQSAALSALRTDRAPRPQASRAPERRGGPHRLRRGAPLLRHKQPDVQHAARRRRGHARAALAAL